METSRISKKDFGFLIEFKSLKEKSGSFWKLIELTEKDMEVFSEKAKTALASIKKGEPFKVIVVLTDCAFNDKALIALQRGQEIFKAFGMIKSAVFHNDVSLSLKLKEVAILSNKGAKSSAEEVYINVGTEIMTLDKLRQLGGI